MQNKQAKILITDLDGTLRDTIEGFPENNIEALQSLEKKDITRVIASGRSIYSANNVLSTDFPIDYFIFSSGAGIMNWKTKEIIYERHLTGENVAEISKELMDIGLDFMIHLPIPENHKFYYHSAGNETPDFIRRCDVYSDYIIRLNGEHESFGDSSQMLAIINDDVDLFIEIVARLNSKFNNIKLIRTTSPLDNNSIWLEIFPKDVSKGNASEWLCNKLGLNKNDSIAIGNDYNDIDLLKWSPNSYVVANAPEELKQGNTVIESCLDSGVAKLINRLFSD
ncbi:MAG: Cof-type HAD-IIB family hydrolase [Saprospiraceae bacterium]|nr:Cof-type HAD-IIB family hydrolase [Saprospiraceae bacterium]